MLSSEGEDGEALHVCFARSSVDHGGRVAVRSSQTVPSPPKRLRLTCGNLHRLSQASTVPRPAQSLCDALEFDLTREDSDHDPIFPCAGIQWQTHHLPVSRPDEITTEFWQQNPMSRTSRVFSVRATGGEGCS